MYLLLFLQVSNWATMAFFMYGGDAQYNLNPAGFGADRGPMVSNIGPGKDVSIYFTGFTDRNCKKLFYD